MTGYPLVYVEWMDSSSPDGWHDPDPKPTITSIKSVGWLTNDTEEAIILTGHRDEQHNIHCADMTIPKVAITKFKTIRLHF